VLTIQDSDLNSDDHFESRLFATIIYIYIYMYKFIISAFNTI